MSSSTDHPRLLRTEQAAEYLSIPPNTLHHWRHLGKGPAYIRVNAGVGRNVVRYDRRALEEWLAAHTVIPGEL